MSEIICANCDGSFQTDSVEKVSLPWYCSFNCREAAEKQNVWDSKNTDNGSPFNPKPITPSPKPKKGEVLEDPEEELSDEVLDLDSPEGSVQEYEESSFDQKKEELTIEEYYFVLLTDFEKKILEAILGYTNFLSPQNKQIEEILQKTIQARKVKIKK